MKHIIAMIAVLLGGPHYLAASCTPIASTVGTNAWSILDVSHALICESADHVITQTGIPFTITEPGIYVLGENIVDPDGTISPIIDIQSDDVVLDLMGKNLLTTRSNNAGTMIEAVNRRNITIQNGTLGIIANPAATFFVEYFMIDFSNTTGITLKNLTINGSEDLDFEPSVQLNSCIGVTIRNCILHHLVFIDSDSLGRDIVIRDCACFNGPTNITILANNQVSHRIFASGTRDISLQAGISFSSAFGAGVIRNVYLTKYDLTLAKMVGIDCSTYGGEIVLSSLGQHGVIYKCQSGRRGGSTAIIEGIELNNASAISCTTTNNRVPGFRGVGSISTITNCYATNNQSGFNNFTGVFLGAVTTLPITGTATFWGNVQDFPIL